ncbi:HAMP domain-containing sensor histidine kinase [Nitrospirillum sp. BR 11828]|uniref:sensor histidine kinase n=1 Tax=Nitrospirillum sp. BR 11828 TaxID=3104325 RepID=UPI002ACAE1CC|nr:HAMP domain-containing sensor histidine kinase [Nitrospirillum sp. BR 11828]MDZ5646006.1 HAMP domain-containing sensor histidine kinase [Nitrospirillum sp. BR 11828]
MLDIATSMVFVGVLTASNCIAAFLMWRAYRQLHGLASVSAGCLALTTAFALMVVRDPHLITAGNAAMTLAIGLVTDGMVALLGGRPRRDWVLGATVFTVLFWELVQWGAPDSTLVRVAVATVVYIGFYARLLVEVIRSSAQIRGARICLILTLVGHMAVLVGRMAVALVDPDPFFVFSPRFLPWFQLEGAVVMMLTFFCIMFMVGAQLSATLKQRTLSLAAERRMHTQLRQFLGTLGHELRTPLAIIDRSAEVSLDLLDPAQPLIIRRLDTIRATVDRLRGMMDNLLMAERAELEVSDAERVDVARIVRDLMRLLAQKYEDGRITAALPETPTHVRGNREMLATAIGNILDNALKYSPADEPVHITVQQGGSITITVEDRGIGFPPHQLPQVGQRFFRADNARAVQGTGLGLAIVKTIVNKHSGLVTFANATNGGAVATIVLPSADTEIKP